MPNRIIKESIRESDSIDKLSPHAEVLFYRLITYADDYGLFKADPRIVNPAIFPLKGYKEKQVIEWMDEIGTAGMIAFYRAGDGKPYGTFTSWEKHQQIRNNKSKYPSPDGCKQEISISILLKSIEINCNQLTAVAPVILIQSNPIHKRSFDTFWKAYPKLIFMFLIDFSSPKSLTLILRITLSPGLIVPMLSLGKRITSVVLSSAPLGYSMIRFESSRLAVLLLVISI